MLTPFRTRTDVIDKREGRYLSFPDVVRCSSGKLLVAYREADIHYPPKPEETFLLLCESTDEGKTWSKPRKFAHSPKDPKRWSWHCPRLSLMKDGRIALLCDLSAPELSDVTVYFMTSTDEGKTWSEPQDTGALGIMPDRLIQLSEAEWIFTVHYTRPKIKHYYQELYATEDAGKTWRSRSLVVEDPLLCFCEASIVQFSDKSLMCFLRENSFLNLPTYVTTSEDGGLSWTKPVAHPTHGHRPCAGVLKLKDSEENLLVTHRNVAGNTGLSAWVGKRDERGETVGGADYDGEAVYFGSEGLNILSSGKASSVGMFFLQPLLDWNAEFEVSLRLKRINGDRNAVGVRAGALFRFLDEYVELEHLIVTDEGIKKVSLGKVEVDTHQFHDYRIRGANRELSFLIDGKEKLKANLTGVIPPADRRISFGNIFESHPAEMLFRYHKGESVWQKFSLDIKEKSGREVHWSWESKTKEFPNREQRAREIQMDIEDSYEWYDSGYSGWVQIGPKKVYCVDYRRGKEKKPYIVGHTIRIDS